MSLNKEYKIIKSSGLFDAIYYLQEYADIRQADIDPLKHFCEYGWKEGRNPAARFNTNFYFTTYPDVKNAGMNPLFHFIKFGSKEGRKTHIENSISFEHKISSIRKILKIAKHVKHNPYLIKKFINEARNFGIKKAIKKAKSKSGFSSASHILYEHNKRECSFKHSGKEYDIKVSVIIPTYNRSKLLPSLLDSWREVNKVTKYKYEIIFSDDGSEDGSVEILETVKDLPIIVLKNNHGGAAKARNNAILHAKGEKLYIIGDDIFPNPHIINQHYEKLKELPICKAVLGEIIWHKDLKINTLMKHITELGCEQFSFNAFPPYGYIDFRHFYTSNISIDREFLLSESVTFNNKFNKYGFEDIELGYRLSKKGMDIYYYPEAIAEHYHPYTKVKGFCTRQENAGSMGVVFKALHKDDVEWVVQVEQVSVEWKKYVSALKNQKSNNAVNKIIELCQILEDNDYVLEYNLEKEISNIYKILFRFYYEKGIIANSYNLDEDIINQVFEKYFLPQCFHYLNKINVVIPMSLIDEISLNQNNYSDTKLIIKVRNQVLINEVAEYYKECQNDILIVLNSEAKELDTNYIYAPSEGFYIHPSNLKQLILFIQNNPSIDYILLSFGLVDLPNIGMTKDLQNHVVFKNNGLSIEGFKCSDFRGKVIRLLSERYDSQKNIQELINQSIDSYGFWNKIEKYDIKNEIVHFSHVYPKQDKKLVFVFPIFLAVGGVERNTAEIINALQNEYDFVIVNFERLNEPLGTLHHQFLENCVAIYDLTELSSHGTILTYLQMLNVHYKPDLIWICNGSPWLEHNLGNIRSIFKNSAIVDQQVYDTNEGWVRLYKEKNPSLLSFDRFIAINSKIKDVFENQAHISTTKVDLIYPVIKSERFNKSLYLSEKNQYLKEYGIIDKSMNFAFVGRMNEQKRPLLFIDFVEEVCKYRQNIHFYMIGAGPMSEKVEKYIKNKNLEKHITRIYHLENIAKIYSLMDGLIITSKYEGLPIAMLEAMCMELPVFATNVGDIDVIINKYHNGLLNDMATDGKQLGEAFAIFLNNINVYKANAISSSLNIRERFSEATLSKLYIQTFLLALENK